MSGRLTPQQHASITRQFNSLQLERRGISKNRIVFVPVGSAYRRSQSVRTGEVVSRTNKGVFVSVNRAQIERTKRGRVVVNIGRGGRVSIRYGFTRVETIPINQALFARDPGKYIQRQFAQSGANAMSLVINGFESRMQWSGGFVETGTWHEYINQLLVTIERDIQRADGRRTKKTVKNMMSNAVAMRFYYYKRAPVETISLEELMSKFKPDPGEDFTADFLSE